jgi:hypothetical protein
MTHLIKTYKCSKCADTYQNTMTDDEYKYHLSDICTDPEEPLGTFDDPITKNCSYCDNKEEHKKKLFLETSKTLHLLKDKLQINKKIQYCDLCDFCQKRNNDINFIPCSACEAQQPYGMIAIDMITDILNVMVRPTPVGQGVTNLDVLKKTELFDHGTKKSNYIINDITENYKCQCPPKIKFSFLLSRQAFGDQKNNFQDLCAYICNANNTILDSNIKINKTYEISLISNGNENKNIFIGHPIFLPNQKDSITNYVREKIKKIPYDYNNILICNTNCALWITK